MIATLGKHLRLVAWAAALAAALWSTGSACAASTDDDLEAGRRIYRQGILSDGTPLVGTRWGEGSVSGAQAACAQCHRASGMGSVEGDIQIPPITGHALFGGEKVVATMDPRSGKAFNQRHELYTDATLVEALRHGRASGDRDMNEMMPRYALGDTDARLLNGYLRQLSTRWSPGVSADTIRFASVITPGVDARQRAVFKDMLAKAVQQKNGSTAVASKKGGRRHMAGAAEMVLGTERHWIVDVWELQGPADTWAGQLDALYDKSPVFALVSGLGSDDWGPVQEFCERHALPAWFPSVALPPEQASRWSLYFSRGVALEAAVLAAHLTAPETVRPARVIQVFHDDYVGTGAAQALARALAGSAVRVENRAVARGDAAALRAAIAEATASDALMLWLKPDDVRLLDAVPTPEAAVYFSAHLSEPDNHTFPAAWKQHIRLAYPYELPDRRQANVAYFKAWVRNRRVDVVDEPMQSEVYFALAFLTDTVTEMLDNLYRDYLVERAENMISRRESSKAEAEVWASTLGIRHRLTQAPENDGTMIPDATPSAIQQAGMAPAGRQGTTVYPRLGLGPGQRFASKGGYIAGYADGPGETLVAHTGWIVP